MPLSDLPTTSHTGVNQTAVRITPVDTKAKAGLQIYTDANNTSSVYIGQGTGITAQSGANDGFPLPADSSLFLPIVEVDEIYGISDVSGQHVWWLNL